MTPADPQDHEQEESQPGNADAHDHGKRWRSGRSGLDIAREALAAARADARSKGLNLRTSASFPESRSTPQTSRARLRGSARGEELRSGPGPDDRDPQGLARAVDRLTTERGWGVELAVGSVLGRWDEFVGADVAAHAQPEGFTDGTLVVRTDSTAWATQLRLLAPTLRRHLDAELGAGVVRRISVLGPTAPSWHKGAYHIKGRGPRDTYG